MSQSKLPYTGALAMIVVISALATPAQAGFLDAVRSLSWDEFLADPKVSGQGFMEALSAESPSKSKPTTIVACFASDKDKLMKDPAVTKAWEKASGHKVELPSDNLGKLFGSVDVMKMGAAGKCDLVSPDASVVGFGFDYWKPEETILFVSGYTVGIVDPLLAKALAEAKGLKPEQLNYTDLVAVAGTEWREIAGDSYDYGPIRVHATDVDRSGSGYVVMAALVYSYAAANQLELNSRALAHDEALGALMKKFFHDVDHSEGSTSRLTTKCVTEPASCPIFFTYESKIEETEKAWGQTDIGTPVVIYGNAAIQADHRVMITTNDPDKRSAAVDFLKFLRSPEVQRLAAEKYTFRPAIPLDNISGPVAKLKGKRLRTVIPDRAIVGVASRYKN